MFCYGISTPCIIVGISWEYHGSILGNDDFTMTNDDIMRISSGKRDPGHPIPEVSGCKHSWENQLENGKLNYNWGK